MLVCWKTHQLPLPISFITQLPLIGAVYVSTSRNVTMSWIASLNCTAMKTCFFQMHYASSSHKSLLLMSEGSSWSRCWSGSPTNTSSAIAISPWTKVCASLCSGRALSFICCMSYLAPHRHCVRDLLLSDSVKR